MLQMYEDDVFKLTLSVDICGSGCLVLPANVTDVLRPPLQ